MKFQIPTRVFEILRKHGKSCGCVLLFINMVMVVLDLGKV